MKRNTILKFTLCLIIFGLSMAANKPKYQVYCQGKLLTTKFFDTYETAYYYIQHYRIKLIACDIVPVNS